MPDAIRGAIRNNAGGHSNHAFFWTIMGPGKGGAPKGKLAEAINATWGSFDNFKAEFAKAAAIRPRIVGQAMHQISNDQEVAAALFEILETQNILESKGRLTLVPANKELLNQLLSANQAK